MPKGDNSLGQRVGVRQWGEQLRQWVTNGVSALFLLVVKFFIVLKSGYGFLQDLFLSGWELLTKRIFSTNNRFDTDKIITEPCQDTKIAPSMARNAVLEQRSDRNKRRVVQREVVEMAKISHLATEEENLPEELLVDQAGALRSKRVGSVEGMQ